MRGSASWGQLSLHLSDREFHRLRMQQHKICHTRHRCVLGCHDLIDECFYLFSSVWTERSCVYVVWWPLDAFLFRLVYFYLCLLSWQSQRNSKKGSLTELQTETMFIQLLSCPAWGIQNWHLNSLACLQDRPKKSVFLICTMVRQGCRNSRS